MEYGRVRVYVGGFVQGIGYRFFCQRCARKLNLKGYAKNFWDGKVEVLTEGEKDKILQFLELIKVGHQFADVKNFEAKWEEYKQEFMDFDVR
jgi:acylphosphatase